MQTIEPEKDWLAKIKEGYEQDKEAKKMLQLKFKKPLKYAYRIYIPQHLLEELIRDHYDNPKYKHPGIKRIIELIQRNYNALNLISKIA